MQAQVQAVAQAVSQQESQALVLNLVNISISEILSARHLLPSSSFVKVKFGGASMRKLKDVTVLEEDRNDKAHLLARWLGQNVSEAITKQYAKEIILEAVLPSKDPNGEEELEVFETYKFAINYRADSHATEEDVTVEITRGTTAPPNSSICKSRDEIKSQTKSLIRSLTAVLGTMSELPPQCWLRMRLIYTEDTPKDFKCPDFNRDVSFEERDSEMINLRRNPVGSLHTQSHSLQVNLEWDEKENMQEVEMVKTAGVVKTVEVVNKVKKTEQVPEVANTRRSKRKKDVPEETDFQCSQEMSLTESKSFSGRVSVTETPLHQKRRKREPS